MVKRALLIASQTAGLRGCHGDVALMDDALSEWGFDCTRLTDGSATRATILAAYRALIDQSQTGDAAVIYYSGHGGRVRDLSAIDEVTNTHWQFIVPADFNESTEREFRGIMAGELRAMQLELSTKTDNVTTILDCCHSALMSRDPVLVARFLHRPWAKLKPGIDARQDQAGADLSSALALPGTVPDDAESNRRAVRIVACLPSESAFEMASPELGDVHGLLTESLVGVLRSAKLADPHDTARLTWDDVAGALRVWVLARAAQQHVVVEGPDRRRLFSTAQSDARRGWPVELAEGIVRIPGAALFGVGLGDVLSLVPSSHTDDTDVGHEATVVRMEGGRAVLELVNGSDASGISPGSVAYPTRITSGRRQVVVEAPMGLARDEVIASISTSSRPRRRRHRCGTAGASGRG